MIVISLKKSISNKKLNHILEKIESIKLIPHITKSKNSIYIGLLCEMSLVKKLNLNKLSGIIDVKNIDKPFWLPGRDYKKKKTIVKIGDVKIGNSKPIIIAGPCAVESKKQIFHIAREVKKAGADILRGGAFKPRTSPYSFQGLKENGLKLLKEAGVKYNMPIITEILTIRDIELVCKYTDILQVGARNMQNFPLLEELGKLNKPILLKRSTMATIEELLMSSEYILARGNENVILCERGIRTFEKYTRNTIDLSAVPLLKDLSHLPIMVDPSHGTGIRKIVPDISRAAIAAGADGLLIEVHNSPNIALSDGFQSINIPEFNKLMKTINKIYKALYNK